MLNRQKVVIELKAPSAKGVAGKRLSFRSSHLSRSCCLCESEREGVDDSFYEAQEKQLGRVVHFSDPASKALQQLGILLSPRHRI